LKLETGERKNSQIGPTHQVKAEAYKLRTPRMDKNRAKRN